GCPARPTGPGSTGPGAASCGSVAARQSLRHRLQPVDGPGGVVTHVQLAGLVRPEGGDPQATVEQEPHLPRAVWLFGGRPDRPAPEIPEQVSALQGGEELPAIDVPPGHRDALV